MENLVKIFQTLTQLKQNGHNVEGFEQNTYLPEQQLTMALVDKLVSLISMVQVVFPIAPALVCASTPSLC